MNYYPFHLGDYAMATMHLTPIQDLAYRRMIDWCYANEKALPKDPKRVAVLIRLNDFLTDVEQVLNEFFNATENGHENKRISEEIERYKSKKVQQSEAGKASAEARKNKRSTGVKRTSNQPEPKPNISTSLRSVDKPKKQRSKKTQIPDDFMPCETAINTLKSAGISVESELQKFRDHALANGKLQLDWQATFRTWATNAVNWKPARASPPKYKTAADRQIDMANAMFGDLVNGHRRTIDVSQDGAEGDRPPLLVAGDRLR